MGSMPLPALDIRPPQESNPLDMAAKVMQIKALMQGQQLGAAELQGHNLQNQQVQMTLQGQQRVMEAMKDPEWNPTDIDTAYRLLQKHSVPVANQENVIKFISTMREGLAKAHSEDLKYVADTHSTFDDLFQSVKSAPDDKKQSAYQDALSKAKIYASSVPDPHTRQQMLTEISQAPALYDSQFIDNEHAQLRTMQYLVDEAHKKAQTREAAGKGAQAEEEQRLLAAKVPGAQAQSTIEQQNAVQGPQGRALAGNLFYQAAGGNAQAGKALQLETQQKAAAAAAGGKTNARSDKSFQYNNGELDKVGKPIEDALARFGRLQATIQQNTPQADALVAPELLTVMAGGAGSGLRMNEAEISRIVGGRSKWEDLKAAVNKWSLDPKEALSITPEQRTEIRSLMDEVHGRLLKKQAILDKSRDDLINTDDPTEHRKIVAGARSSLTKLDSGEAQGGATVKMKAPNGQVSDVPANQVEHFKSLGATVVKP